jgi:uncharacterized protein YndB with AHSA1/START domain
MATDSIRVSATIPASPERIYEAWLSGAGHAAMTGSAATFEPAVGGRFTAWNGYISGETVELEEGRKIVQMWRTVEFPEGCAPSRLEVLLEPVSGGTNVVFLHTEIPEGDGEKYEQGWQKFYVEPMKKYFGDGANAESSAEVKVENGAPGKRRGAPRKAAAKKTARRKAPAAKAAARKAPAKKVAARKAPAAKAAARKAPAAKATAKKAPAKKAPAAKALAAKAAATRTAAKATKKGAKRVAASKATKPAATARGSRKAPVAAKASKARATAGKKAAPARAAKKR